MEPTYYDILNLDRDASLNDIKKSFRNLAKRYHPDISKEPGTEEIFQIIQEAYEVLSNDDRRAAYDEFLFAQEHTSQNNYVNDLQQESDKIKKSFCFNKAIMGKTLKFIFWIAVVLIIPTLVYFKNLDFESVLFYFVGLILVLSVHKVVIGAMSFLSFVMIVMGFFTKDSKMTVFGIFLLIVSFIAMSLSHFFIGELVDDE